MPIRADLRRHYGAAWRRLSRRIRFERAGGRCECQGECGLDHGGRCPERHGTRARHFRGTVVLTTGHVDQVPGHDDDANLRAWCQACHLRFDAFQHAGNARATRHRRRQEALAAAGQMPLWEHTG